MSEEAKGENVDLVDEYCCVYLTGLVDLAEFGLTKGLLLQKMRHQDADSDWIFDLKQLDETDVLVRVHMVPTCCPDSGKTRIEWQVHLFCLEMGGAAVGSADSSALSAAISLAVRRARRKLEAQSATLHKLDPLRPE